MMGIPNWTNKERAARFKEYVEFVDLLLSNETTSYKGRFYGVNDAMMNPRPYGSVLKVKRTTSRTKDWRRGEVLGSGIGPSHSGISPKPAKQRCDQRHRELSEFITPGEIR